MARDAPRVAVIAEWMAQFGGAEPVTREIRSAFPGAELWTLAWDEGESPSPRSPLGLRLPAATDRRVLAAVSSVAWTQGRFRPADYDLVISSHHLQTHTAATRGVPHLSYVHSPARYAWFPDVDQRASGRLAKLLAARIRRRDLAAATRVTSYAANSATTAARLRRVWNRDATVIHPPIDTDRWMPSSEGGPRDYLVAASRFTPYKRLDFAIEVASSAGVPLVLVGKGDHEVELRRLAAAANTKVTVVTGPSNTEFVRIMQGAKGLLFPGEEDFGLIPLEAMACGVPVVALGRGGATETVNDSVTGYLIPGHEVEEWVGAVHNLHRLDPSACRERAVQFNKAAFREAIREWALPWLQ